jgi:hypothetical protein
MRLQKPIGRRGQSDSLSELVQSVEKLFNQNTSTRKYVQSPVGTMHLEKTRVSLDSLEGEKCKWCAKDFEPRQYNQICCSRRCIWKYSNEIGRLARAEQRKTLTCIDCGTPILGAHNTQTTLCATCRRAHRLANCKANRERTKAGTNGRRGRNQFSRPREG